MSAVVFDKETRACEVRQSSALIDLHLQESGGYLGGGEIDLSGDLSVNALLWEFGTPSYIEVQSYLSESYVLDESNKKIVGVINTPFDEITIEAWITTIAQDEEYYVFQANILNV